MLIYSIACYIIRISFSFWLFLHKLTVVNKYILLNNLIADDNLIWAKSQIYVMSYLFSSHAELDLLTLIAFSCCYTTNVFVAFSINVIYVRTSFFVISHFWHC